MPLSPFHALYKAHKLSNYAFGQDRLTAVFASSDIEVYPYQIAAARFALRSPYLKGVILCDEGSLGKTYEALLIILPYNTLTIEQRINRCHRQGQQSDVIILNFLNRNNFADVRTLELINKRILQFSGIFGMSDSVIGNFNNDLERGFSNVLSKARTRQEIDQAHQTTLEQFEAENKQLVRQAEHSLFTSFTKNVAEQVHITPQYIESKTREIE